MNKYGLSFATTLDAGVCLFIESMGQHGGAAGLYARGSWVWSWARKWIGYPKCSAHNLQIHQEEPFEEEWMKGGQNPDFLTRVNMQACGFVLLLMTAKQGQSIINTNLHCLDTKAIHYVLIVRLCINAWCSISYCQHRFELMKVVTHFFGLFFHFRGQTFLTLVPEYHFCRKFLVICLLNNTPLN